jgi:hypothetical protein
MEMVELDAGWGWDQLLESPDNSGRNSSLWRVFEAGRIVQVRGENLRCGELEFRKLQDMQIEGMVDSELGIPTAGNDDCQRELCP